ncbi:nuclear transport factor 2 family protein [Colwellia piezophila]|uniref:nuclear transport factor 2 family protein n=1 Tax=Colwellia piezophila TaxID=211668 RepID=UPI00037F98AF|nr:nuclear transport factor 2 family protein [Colwellia piezophila]
MKFCFSALLACLLALPTMVNAQGDKFNYQQFTQDYFAAWTNVQKPKATQQDLDHYLSFLTDDIGYQHLPYANDDSRTPDGKAMMRKGMSYYLGIHTEYQAKLINSSFAQNVITIEFHTQAKGIHPDNGQEIVIDNTVFEVLEIENGKISVIRHYIN